MTVVADPLLLAVLMREVVSQAFPWTYCSSNHVPHCYSFSSCNSLSDTDGLLSLKTPSSITRYYLVIKFICDLLIVYFVLLYYKHCKYSVLVFNKTIQLSMSQQYCTWYSLNSLWNLHDNKETETVKTQKKTQKEKGEVRMRCRDFLYFRLKLLRQHVIKVFSLKLIFYANMISTLPVILVLIIVFPLWISSTYYTAGEKGGALIVSLRSMKSSSGGC